MDNNQLFTELSYEDSASVNGGSMCRPQPRPWWWYLGFGRRR